MKTTAFKIPKEELENYVSLYQKIAGNFSLFSSNNYLDPLFRTLTRVYGNKIQIHMGSRFLHRYFARNYFFKNLFKNLATFCYISNQMDISNDAISFSINDIGCGLAPSSLAYELLFDHKEAMTFNIIDNSKYQLNCAKRLLQYRDISNIKISNKDISHCDFGEFKGLTVASYLLCEQNKKERNLLRSNIEKITGHFVCIDYEKNISEFSKKINGFSVVFPFKISVQLTDRIKRIIGSEEITVNGLYLFK